VNGKRYDDLSPSVRRWLETLDDQKVADLVNLQIFYRDLVTPPFDGKGTPIDFLMNAGPRTFEWLRNASKEDIDQLNEAIALVRSSRTVGRFLRWSLITAVGMGLAMSQFGELLVKFFKKPL